MKGTVLLTGFEPFGGSHVNPSIEACRRLEGKTYNGYRVAVEEIPLRYYEVRPRLLEALSRHKPAAVICTGQSGAATINVERVAINVADARIPYNCGDKPVDRPIVKGGKAAYFTGLPYRRLLKALTEAKVPCSLSNSAGTFGCNHVFYELMHHVSEHQLGIPAGFIHVPSLPEQVLEKKTPSMSLDTIVRGL
ncbi:pyroglutamyl-peptidase I [Candidatus Bathyarchaeota archaeon]|nr:pyroglutamyl-peptidase I [Candidatus Bathyarchaeota archaeon]